MDEKRHRIALGMKSSYIGESSEIYTHVEQEHDDVTDDDDLIGDIRLPMHLDSSSTMFQNMDIELDSVEPEQPLSLAESRAFVPPLEVNLDDVDETDMDGLRCENKELVSVADSPREKDRREKKKAKEER